MKNTVSLLAFAAVSLLSAAPLTAQVEVVSNGNVGVGTTAPGRKLDVNHDLGVTAGEKFVASFTQTLGQNGLFLGYRANGSGVTSGLIRADNNLPITFGTSASNEAVTISNSGNVGIGTANPTRKLSIHAQYPEAVLKSSAVSGGTGGSTLYFGNAASDSAGWLDYDHAANSLSVRVNEAERLRISANGNVGIGTSTPQSRLHVLGDLRSDAADYPGLYVLNGATPLAAIRVDVANAIMDIGDFYSSAPSLALRMHTSDMERLRITANGNVGIGTSAPGHKLEVAGTVRATSFISNTTTYADFVFKPGYQLASLAEVEQHINQHGTLPGVPSEAQVAKEGIDLAAMQVKLLQKIEELTLHAIAQERKMEVLAADNAELRTRVEEIEGGLLP